MNIMDTEEKEFNDYLKNFNSLATSLSSEEQKSFAKDELIGCMKKEIVNYCSAEFVKLMNRAVSQEIKNINLFGFGSKTNIDYLVEVIFISLTQSSPIMGFEYFIAPGETRKASYEFCNKFFKDFIKVKELFRVELKKQSYVKMGYAMIFYKP